MAVLQSTYSDKIARGLPGNVSRSELCNIISRTLESATAAFGALALEGANQHGCITAALETLAASAAVATGGNTGNGTFAGIPTITAGAKEGTYRVVVEDDVTNSGRFIVEDPDGVIVGVGSVGSAFSAGGVSFTLNDGATDFVADDSFTFAVAPTTGTNEGPQLGIFRTDTTLGAEVVNYRAGDNAAIVTQGPIDVMAGGTVHHGNRVYFNPSTGRYVAVAGATVILVQNCRFDEDGGDGDVVQVSLSNRPNVS